MILSKQEMKEKYNCVVRFKRTNDNKIVSLPSVKKNTEVDQALYDAVGKYHNFILIGQNIKNTELINYALSGNIMKSDISFLFMTLQKLVNEWLDE